MTTQLTLEPLTREAFAPYGDVIEIAGRPGLAINQGTTLRYHDLARVDFGQAQTLVSIFRTQPRPWPIAISLMERHPLGSQAFMPLSPHDWLVVVAAPGDRPAASSMRAFRAAGSQGVNYARNVWHHPLLVLRQDSDFLVIDPGSEGNNLEEHWFEDGAGFQIEKAD